MLDTPSTSVTHDLSYGVASEFELAETYEWNVDDTVMMLRIDGTTLTQRPGPARDPCVTIRTTRVWMAELVSGGTDPVRGRASGEVDGEVDGDDEAWQRMLTATAQPGQQISLDLE